MVSYINGEKQEKGIWEKKEEKKMKRIHLAEDVLRKRKA